MIGFDFWVQLFVLLACLFYAAPRGGMTLGLMGGIGLIIFIFGFGLPDFLWADTFNAIFTDKAVTRVQHGMHPLS